MRILLGIFFLVASSYADSTLKVLAVCGNAKIQSIDLISGKKTKFRDNSQTIAILCRENAKRECKDKSYFIRKDILKKGSPIIPVFMLPGNEKDGQFLELNTKYNSSKLYTFHMQRPGVLIEGILTSQSSFKLGKKLIMENTILECKNGFR